MTRPKQKAKRVTESLLTRLREATGGSRELADEVLLACGWTTRIDFPRPYPHDHVTTWISPDYTEHAEDDRPNPLTSIDAAFATIPQDWVPRIEPRFYDDPDTIVWWVNMIKPNWPRYQAVLHGLEDFEAVGIQTHTNMLLGICIASLLARGIEL